MAVNATITAVDSFTDWISPRLQKTLSGPQQGELNLSIWGTSWSGTVTLQRTFDNGTTVLSVETFTEDSEQVVVDTEAGVKYRLGVTSASSISGTVNVRLG